jgi:hypothetical protein
MKEILVGHGGKVGSEAEESRSGAGIAEVFETFVGQASA